MVDNPRYYRHPSYESYIMGILPTQKCRICGGSGYIIGNLSDIVERLRAAVNGVTISPKEAKGMLDVILK